MLSMAVLEEDTLLQNIRQRYDRDQIYTAVGPVLVSLNPYCKLPLYNLAVAQRYYGEAERKMRAAQQQQHGGAGGGGGPPSTSAEALPPHIYQVMQTKSTRCST